MTDTIKDVSENLTKTMTETSIKRNQPNWDLNENVLELKNDKGMNAPYLVSSLVILFKPENKSQFQLFKAPNSIKLNDFLIKTNITVTIQY